MSQEAGTVTTINAIVDRSVTLQPGVYTFVIMDNVADGLCCINPNGCCDGYTGDTCCDGSYDVTLDGRSIIDSVGTYYYQSTTFTVGTPAAATGTSKSVRVVVKHDTTPDETGWILFGAARGVVLSQDALSGVSENALVDRSATVPPGYYVFVITDIVDGICCDYGNGYFEVYIGNTRIKRGDRFRYQVVTPFTVT
jgi:hypothetical protein